MYIPTAFAETDQGKLHDFIDAHSFGLLVSTQGSVPVAAHLLLLGPLRQGHRRIT